MDDLVADFVYEATESLGGLRVGLGRLTSDSADSIAAGDVSRSNQVASRPAAAVSRSLATSRRPA
jgi:hypothetical protein